MQHDTKQAEKDYLRRSGGGAWESSKPFPPPGQVATEEHAQHLLDFAVLLQVLAPRAADRVLDLGAGSCWVSEWLRRCGVRTVALDISWDMLHLGMSRLGSPAGLVTGDMERLPFADGAFSKACCISAFHHVPDRDAALREIRRVLQPDGVVLFSEPGAGHAGNPTSIAATRNYGVLETEILIEDFMESCRVAGFADVRLHPITNVVPLFVLNREDWERWRAYTASTRPMRAATKLYRAVLELFGLRKSDLLFEEAFAIRLLRELQPIIEQRPVVTAHCAPFVAPAKTHDAARIELLSGATAATAGGTLPLELAITNVGTTMWRAADGGAPVRVGIQLLSREGDVIDRDYSRHELPADVTPGGRTVFSIPMTAPVAAGSYVLKIDLVREGVAWFELSGSRALVHPLRVDDPRSDEG